MLLAKLKPLQCICNIELPMFDHACCSEDFLRQTEFGYGEENLGGDDLSELRAASDGHGPYARY